MQKAESNPQLLPPMPPMTTEERAQVEQENRRRYSGRNRRNALTLFAWLIVLFAAVFGYEYFTRLPFDSSRWKSASVAVRGRMVDDLLASDKLQGLSHAEVVELLGKPDGFDVRGRKLGYTVGVSKADPVAMVIKFDESKRVSEVEVITVG